jgi:cytochrome c2
MSMGSSSGGEDNSQKKSGDDKVPPTGPASIDHGGITEIPDDPKLAKKGEKLFSDNGCTACHKMKKSQVGPALGGVTERREPEWIARMIMHPRKMLSKDPTAKKLLQEHGSRMANQGISPDEAKAIIAWLATQSAE